MHCVTLSTELILSCWHEIICVTIDSPEVWVRERRRRQGDKHFLELALGLAQGTAKAVYMSEQCRECEACGGD